MANQIKMTAAQKLTVEDWTNNNSSWTIMESDRPAMVKLHSIYYANPVYIDRAGKVVGFYEGRDHSK
jgi:hypothetical protein